MLRILIAVFVATALAAATAAAQTQAPTKATAPAPTQNGAAFDQLSPGGKKHAQALFDAQTTKKFSRDEIVAMHLNGKGWGEIFKELKAQGLVKEKNLGQLMRKHERQARHPKVERTEHSGRPEGEHLGKKEREDRDEHPERAERHGKKGR